MASPQVAVGEAMHQLIAELFPICRSITGNGVRHTLARLQREIPLVVHEVPSGTQVLDWVVPDEWNIRDAYVMDADGERVIDFRKSSLHVVSYSLPTRGTFSLAELGEHLHSLPDQPDVIPYRTSYYKPTWGFCLSDHQRVALEEGEYEVLIDSTLAPGALTYGELLIPGKSPDEVLISAHICHPALANDNLSGIALAVALARWVMEQPRSLSYRFVFAPGTIGTITWLAINEEAAGRVRSGLVLSCVGDLGPITYKKSRRGDAIIDRAASHVFRHAGATDRVRDFTPWGYDERQYCSPGFDLPMGCFMRTPHGEFPEYHTSADNLDFVSVEALAESYATVSRIFAVLEGNGVFRTLAPKGEPQLGRRGLYDLSVGGASPEDSRAALLWVLNQSDGGHSLLDIADRSGLPFGLIRAVADALEEGGLLRAA
jgi:aminopeptidase-like protein